MKFPHCLVYPGHTMHCHGGKWKEHTLYSRRMHPFKQWSTHTFYSHANAPFYSVFPVHCGAIRRGKIWLHHWSKWQLLPGLHQEVWPLHTEAVSGCPQVHAAQNPGYSHGEKVATVKHYYPIQLTIASALVGWVSRGHHCTQVAIFGHCIKAIVC